MIGGRRRRLIVFALTIAALLSGLGVTLAFRARWVELWHVRQLESPVTATRNHAAERLARVGSPRALPGLFALFCRENPWDPEPRFDNQLAWVVDEFETLAALDELFGAQPAYLALREIHRRSGAAALPFDVAELRRENLWAVYLALQWIGARGAAGAEGYGEVEALAATHSNRVIRRLAAETLQRLSPPEP